MTKNHILILRCIIDNHGHTPSMTDAREAIETLREKIGEDDFTFDFDGNEYRIIAESAIWNIYVAAIKEIVTDCYDLKLDDIPDFIAFDINWEKTAENAYADGYGHTFSSYNGSEYEVAGYWIFRTN
jgi:mRNA-degrading endonuclease HigB of HigAB toxin-antitoxin module